MINNDLRSVRKITNFRDIETKLEDFIDNLPIAKFLTQIQNIAGYYESAYAIDFGNTFGYKENCEFATFSTNLFIYDLKILENDSETISKVDIHINRYTFKKLKKKNFISRLLLIIKP